MKNLRNGILSGAFVTACAMFAYSANASQCRSIVEIAATTPSLSTLVTAVQQAGMVEQLSLAGSLTVLAPTNAAFNEIPSATLAALLKDRKALRKVLLRHVINSEIDVESFAAGRAGILSAVFAGYGAKQQEVSAANGEQLKYGTFFSNGGPYKFVFEGFDSSPSNPGAKVVQADIEACNGIIHVIDHVLVSRY